MKAISMVLFFFLTGFMANDMFYMSVSDLAVVSDEIIEGRVINVTYEWGEGKRHIRTKTILTVDKSFKGIADEKIILYDSGGRIGRYATFTENQVHYKEGEKVLVFVEAFGNRFRTAGFSLGKFTFDSEMGNEYLKRDISEDEVVRLFAEQEFRNTYSYNEMVNLITNALLDQKVEDQ